LTRPCLPRRATRELFSLPTRRSSDLPGRGPRSERRAGSEGRGGSEDRGGSEGRGASEDRGGSEGRGGSMGTIGVVLGWFAVGCPDRKSTRLNSSHVSISYAVFCLIKK